MKHIYKIVLEFLTDEDFTNEQVQSLFNEQWRQTGASFEGETILIKSIKKLEEESKIENP